MRDRGWRDPDSNRGHHDFQSCGRNSRTAANCLQICRSLLGIPSDEQSHIPSFCRRFGRWRVPHLPIRRRVLKVRAGVHAGPGLSAPTQSWVRRVCRASGSRLRGSDAIWTLQTEDKRGYARHPETVRWRGRLAALYARHEAQVAEMARSGFQHASPLDRAHATGETTQTEFVGLGAQPMLDASSSLRARARGSPCTARSRRPGAWCLSHGCRILRSWTRRRLDGHARDGIAIRRAGGRDLVPAIAVVASVRLVRPGAPHAEVLEEPQRPRVGGRARA